MRTNTYLAIDPGVTTGYVLAYYRSQPKNQLFLAPFQRKHTVYELYQMLWKIQAEHIICEDFEFRQAARDKLELYSVQLIGVISLWAQNKSNANTTIKMQTAATGKSHYKEKESLEKLGIYKKGVPHGMDAMRHLMQWFMFGPGFRLNNDPALEMVELDWLLNTYFDQMEVPA